MKQPYNTTIYNTALYMRLSRDDENYGDSVSIETQRTILQQYAKEQGLHVVGEYVDDGWSGTNFDFLLSVSPVLPAADILPSDMPVKAVPY